MRVPNSLMALLDDGIVEEVVRPLMSGKEAQIYVVVSEGQTRVAKIYKEAERRNFKNRTDYTEGRKVRNSRDARAMAKRSRHGRAQDEAAWRSTEVEMIYLLQRVGVRVPIPYHFIDGVLLMEMVTDEHGRPAPRMGEMQFTKTQAHSLFSKLLGEVQRMLCAGVVHGDLSDFNVLMAADGPVVIDFPQAVYAANNRNARKLLLRDVANLDRFVQRFDAAWRSKNYAEEMWSIYENGDLSAGTVLSGRYVAPTHRAKTDEVIALIDDARQDAQRRHADHPPTRRRPQGQPTAQHQGLDRAPAAPGAQRPGSDARKQQSGRSNSFRQAQQAGTGYTAYSKASQEGRAAENTARPRPSASPAEHHASPDRDSRTTPRGPANGERVGSSTPPHRAGRRRPTRRP